MLEFGKINRLKINRTSPHGMYLISSGEEEVLLPNKYVQPEFRGGDVIEVFVYKDSEDRPVATTRIPAAQLGEFACLKVKETNEVGAFMDWGLEKDLLVPFSEQHKKMETGHYYVVKIALDPKTSRIIGVNKLSDFFIRDTSGLEEGQKADFFIYETTDLGYMAIVDGKYKGMLYKNEVFKSVRMGDRLSGFIKKVREDGKVDLTLNSDVKTQIKDSKDIVWEKLLKNDGVLNLSDKSDPEEITRKLKMSKRNFKMAIGSLFKEGKIKIEKDRIVKV